MSDNPAPNNKIGQIQTDIDEVKGTMNNNINTMMNNHEKLSNLEVKTDELRVGAQQFQKRSTDLKRIMWWRNFKVVKLIQLSIIYKYLFINVFYKWMFHALYGSESLFRS